MLNGLKPRLYQQTIFATASKGNTLVVLPTGLGKTAIFVMLAIHRLKLYPQSKVVFLGPTRPLIDQYKKVFEQLTDIPREELVTFTGLVKPEKRASLWREATVIFSTPQGLENDVLSGRISLEDVSLLGLDESHRAVGDYAYVFLAKEYHQQAKYGRILGLTASPGTDKETIKEVSKNLFIEHIEFRSKEDRDVTPYMQEVVAEQIKVPFPAAFKKIQQALHHCYAKKLKEAQAKGGLKIPQRVNKAELLRIQRSLHAEIAKGEKDYQVFRAISLIAETIKLQHALEVLETQTLHTLLGFMKKLQMEAREGKSKSVKNLVADIDFVTAFGLTHQLYEQGIEHPKVDRVVGVVTALLHTKPHAKVIIFTQFRDTGSVLIKALEQEGIAARLFVGQAKKKETGLTQKEQKAIIEQFSRNEFPVLVSSSVGEEGLDIPVVDSVLFYEPIPSAIRKIQRAGRTGRSEKGSVVVFMTQGTRDEAYFWVSHHKEQRMYRTLEEVKKELNLAGPSPKESLLHYAKREEGTRIVVDHREKGSPVMKQLRERGVALELSSLPVGDYIVGNDIVVEYKTVEDFVASLVDGRLFTQLKQLKTYRAPVLLVEGEQDLYAVRNIHPNALRGLLATIAVDFSLPMLWSRNPQDTAGLLVALSKRDEKGLGSFQVSNKPATTKELQEYIVASLPGVGAVLSRPLLEHFKSVRAIATASVDDLQTVDLIGKKKAKSIRALLDAIYEQ